MVRILWSASYDGVEPGNIVASLDVFRGTTMVDEELCLDLGPMVASSSHSAGTLARELWGMGQLKLARAIWGLTGIEPVDVERLRNAVGAGPVEQRAIAGALLLETGHEVPDIARLLRDMAEQRTERSTVQALLELLAARGVTVIGSRSELVQLGRQNGLEREAARVIGHSLVAVDLGGAWVREALGSEFNSDGETRFVGGLIESGGAPARSVIQQWIDGRLDDGVFLAAVADRVDEVNAEVQDDVATAALRSDVDPRVVAAVCRWTALRGACSTLFKRVIGLGLGSRDATVRQKCMLEMDHNQVLKFCESDLVGRIGEISVADEDHANQDLALVLLASLRPAFPAVIESVVTRLRSADVERAVVLLDAAERLEVGGSALVEVVRDRLRDGSPRVRARALRALALLDPQSVLVDVTRRLGAGVDMSDSDLLALQSVREPADGAIAVLRDVAMRAKDLRTELIACRAAVRLHANCVEANGMFRHLATRLEGAVVPERFEYWTLLLRAYQELGCSPPRELLAAALTNLLRDGDLTRDEFDVLSSSFKPR